ncbi:MAG TPA: ATP cone domain-containing protein, partial [Rhodocyclaceae bacterium]|nr:ATP cone domain-containing protein [Rhodocyclaceae bacterium]
MHLTPDTHIEPFRQALPTTAGLAAGHREGLGQAGNRYKVVRRNGAVVGFDAAKISIAMTKAFLAVHGGQGAVSARVRELVARLTATVVAALERRQPDGGTVHIEDIQDQVELALMRSGEHEVARAYVLYRERRTEERLRKLQVESSNPVIHVVEGDERRPLDMAALRDLVESACAGLGDDVSAQPVIDATLRNLYDGVSADEVRKSMLLAARTLIERDPAYSYVTARLLLHGMRREVFGSEVAHAAMGERYRTGFPTFVRTGIEAGLLHPVMAEFDLVRLADALDLDRDLQFGYLGLQTLYDRYFLHVHGRRIELPQMFFMRVAMGLAVNELDREARAIEFYDVLSRFEFMSSTPTLFNAGTLRPQLSSCYLTTVADDLAGIFDAVKENALLAKFAGGLGNDWTPVRAMGVHIRGTNGSS